MDIDNNFDDFDSVLTPKINKPDQPANNSELALSGINEKATHRLNEILDRSALRDVSDADIRLIVALSPDLMVYDLPIDQSALSGLTDALPLTPDEYLYLFMVDNGIFPAVACKIMGIPKSKPAIWKKTNKLFDLAYRNILDSLADDAEMVSAQEAINNPKANIERMFFIKAHKPEYKDNAPDPAPVAIQLNVTIDNEAIDTTVGYRDIADD